MGRQGEKAEGKSGKAKAGPAARETRLAKALKANLKRRKAQARARSDDASGGGVFDADETGEK